MKTICDRSKESVLASVLSFSQDAAQCVRLFVGLRVTTPCNPLHKVFVYRTRLNITEHFSVSQQQLVQAQCADATKYFLTECSLVKSEVQRLHIFCRGMHCFISGLHKVAQK